MLSFFLAFCCKFVYFFFRAPIIMVHKDVEQQTMDITADQLHTVKNISIFSLRTT